MDHVWVLAMEGDGDISVKVFASQKGAEDAFMRYFDAVFAGEDNRPTEYVEHVIEGWMDEWRSADFIHYELTRVVVQP